MTKLIDTWQEFAEITIKTNDLDPMYSVIYGLNRSKPRDWMGRFIMYFLLFYDAGGAADEADAGSNDSEEWWATLKMLAADPKTKRGTERRHFRGENARKAIENLRNRPINQPWAMLEHMYDQETGLGTALPQPITYTNFYNRMTTAYAGTQFGPYFIWKLYDIFNVCLGMPISLSRDEALKYMPEEPRKAALHFFGSFEEGLDKVTSYIKDINHPVNPQHWCGYAEAETVLCMMKGFFKTKTHTIGDDISEKQRQLSEHPELVKLLPWPVAPEYKAGELK